MLQVIIDTSHQLQYVGMISGRKADVDSLFEDFSSIFLENGLPGRFHWNKLSVLSKNNLKNQLASALQRHNSVKLNIFKGIRPLGESRKDWFIYGFASRVASKLESWLLDKKGEAAIIIDDDFNVIKGGTGTKRFAEVLLRQLSVRLTGKESTLRDSGGILDASIKLPSGKLLSLSASIAAKNSELVGLADIYLGLFIFNPNAFTDHKNVFLHKI